MPTAGGTLPLGSGVPIQWLLETYRPLLHGPDRGDPDLLAWVKVTDKLDAHLKCAMQLAVGNREFAMAKRQLEQTLRDGAPRLAWEGPWPWASEAERSEAP